MEKVRPQIKYKQEQMNPNVCQIDNLTERN